MFRQFLVRVNKLLFFHNLPNQLLSGDLFMWFE